jgi:hypothetical protein
VLPRWVYTETVRRIFDVDPERRLQLVATSIGGPRTPAPTNLWVFQTGLHHVAQVECVREVSRTLVTRMTLYRTAIGQAHPRATVDQYVIVVGDGSVRSLDDPVHTGVYFGLNVLYLRDVPPHRYQDSPGFAVLRRCPRVPRHPAILDEVGMTFGRFLVSVRDPLRDSLRDPLNDPLNNPAVLHDGTEEARDAIAEQLLSLYFQGRFGDHPDVPAEQRHDGWPVDVTVALAVHAITDFAAVTKGYRSRC